MRVYDYVKDIVNLSDKTFWNYKEAHKMLSIIRRFMKIDLGIDIYKMIEKIPDSRGAQPGEKVLYERDK